MIDNLLANRLIDKISQSTEYNVNIMDESGILIANSKSKERIGMFHEVAYNIIKGDKDILVVGAGYENPRLGVEEGVNMAIYVNKRKAGVVGVTGNPQEVMPIAKMIKLSVEIMLEYEMFKYENIKKYNLSEQLLHIIFYNNDFKREDIEEYIQALQLSKQLARVPILIKIKNLTENIDNILNMLRNNELYTQQDLLGITKEGFIFIFKGIDCTIDNMMQDYKFIIDQYLESFLCYAKSNNLRCGIYVGPIQDDILYYRQAYLLCDWMQKYIDKEGRFYFYDYIVKYLETMVSLPEFHAVFLMLKKELGEKFVDNYIEIVEILISTDYNLEKASKIMHLHKNTLVYRLNKIREILNMNPLVCNADRQFMDCFYFYLKYK